jgi:hypothetical protein
MDAKRAGFGVASAILGLIVTLGLAEAVARFALPPPRLQTVNLKGENYRVEGGVPLWGTPPVPCATTHPSAPIAQFYGPSIIAGWSLPPDEVFTSLMQGAFDAANQPLCLENHAVPGFTWQGEHQLAKTAVPAAHPKVVYWGIWVNDPNRYTVVGNWAYNLGPNPHEGAPDPLHLPAGLNTALFEHSKLFWQLDLLIGRDPPPDHGVFERFADEQLSQTLDVVTAAGAELVLVLCPTLNRPFADTIAKPQPYETSATAWADRHQVAHIELAKLLSDQDFDAVDTGDGCDCHFNALGHRLIAERLQPDVERRLSATP